jgi:hypothetical protein
MVVPIGDVTDGNARVFVEKGNVVVMNLFALHCHKDMSVTILSKSILILGTERRQERNLCRYLEALDRILLGAKVDLELVFVCQFGQGVRGS